jgi:hypothetical protein
VSGFDRQIKIILACGCVLKLRSKPMGPTSKFTCRSGRGHSYNQPWTSYMDGVRSFPNEGLRIPKLK